MEQVKVIEVNRYRDGGTIEYWDEFNRKYFTFFYERNRQVFNDHPFSRGRISFEVDHLTPDPWVKEIPVELKIVSSF